MRSTDADRESEEIVCNGDKRPVIISDRVRVSAAAVIVIHLLDDDGAPAVPMVPFGVMTMKSLMVKPLAAVHVVLFMVVTDSMMMMLVSSPVMTASRPCITRKRQCQSHQ